jgi:hypothetical protein
MISVENVALKEAFTILSIPIKPPMFHTFYLVHLVAILCGNL